MTLLLKFDLDKIKINLNFQAIMVEKLSSKLTEK